MLPLVAAKVRRLLPKASQVANERPTKTDSATWVLDLDGVVWLGEEPVPGAARAIAELRAGGRHILFVTNNSSATIAQYLAKLDRVGVAADDGDLVTSAQAAASLVEPGATALICAGAGVEEALSARGVNVVREGDADVVVVGWHRDFTFERLTAACRAIWAGAKFIATNDDPTYPTPDGLLPGGGSIASAVGYATSVEPVFAGKPHRPIADLLGARAAEVEVVVGDRPSTDGLLADLLGAPFALVLSGVTRAGELPVTPVPDYVAADLADLCEQLSGGQLQ